MGHPGFYCCLSDRCELGWTWLWGSCQELEVGQGGLVAGGAVFARRLGGDEGGLGVDDFEDGGFAGSVAEAGETEALAGERYAVVKGLKLVVGGDGFSVELFKLGDELALGIGEQDVRGCRG